MPKIPHKYVTHGNVIDPLERLADADFQCRSWVLGNPSAGVDSFVEAVCQLFDDSNLGDVLEDEGISVVYDLTTDTLLKQLRDKVSEIDSYQAPMLLVNSSQMNEVRILAKQVLRRMSQLHSHYLQQEPDFSIRDSKLSE